MAITNREVLLLTQALVKRWAEITCENIERDIERFDTSDKFAQWCIRAYWQKHSDLLLKIHKIHRQPTTPNEELQLVEEVFGDILGSPSRDLKADVDARLDWLKRRVGKQFEREVKSLFDLHSVSSPIEQIFLMEWHFSKLDESLDVKLLPQSTVNTPTGTFTLDFLVTPRNDTTSPFRIGIELDGHEFHERSKGQVARDKRRERAIVQSGVTILRFAGSEIVRNARSCVDEVLEYVRTKLQPRPPRLRGCEQIAF